MDQDGAFAPTLTTARRVRPEHLGSAAFRRDHRVRYAYVAGSMFKATASQDMVVRMARAGLLAYFGTGGLRPERVESVIRALDATLGADRSYGMNLLSSPGSPRKEEDLVDLLLARRVRRVEAAAFIRMSPALVRYRITGLTRAPDGRVHIPHKVLGKVSRPETAEAYLSPPPEGVVRDLLRAGRVTAEEAELATRVPMADDLCVEADSGGHTDQRPLITLLPDMAGLRDRVAAERFAGAAAVRVGVAGGIGTPEAVAAAFMLNADFVLTGSINQCTVEAGTSDAAKDMLQQAGVQDTAIVPAGDMLEIGAKAQVLRKGLLFPTRANKLYELTLRLNSLDELDDRTARQIQDKYFHRTFDEVWHETAEHLARTDPDQLAAAERDPKLRMILTFKWYFVHSARLAMSGAPEQRVDYQIPCGPSLGALNSLLRGTPREDWRARHVDDLAELLMDGAARLWQRRLEETAARRDDAVPEGTIL
ncbi:PfaD family polyunsaturated fatty acid/polyketide biosynthesis protein [Streptomyces broussonetiae]|uniref:PfaD family polyunsaturated fatty acid/polyketide biosynthesis protein n=1 Tax=Streptomyces broussonetiae TaxID=2686304 RepID=A0ABV5ECP5_9ACTN